MFIFVFLRLCSNLLVCSISLTRVTKSYLSADDPDLLLSASIYMYFTVPVVFLLGHLYHTSSRNSFVFIRLFCICFVVLISRVAFFCQQLSMCSLSYPIRTLLIMIPLDLPTLILQRRLVFLSLTVCNHINNVFASISRMKNQEGVLLMMLGRKNGLL